MLNYDTDQYTPELPEITTESALKNKKTVRFSPSTVIHTFSDEDLDTSSDEDLDTSSDEDLDTFEKMCEEDAQRRKEKKMRRAESEELNQAGSTSTETPGLLLKSASLMLVLAFVKPKAQTGLMKNIWMFSCMTVFIQTSYTAYKIPGLFFAEADKKTQPISRNTDDPSHSSKKSASI
jgi:hypothetical protein